MTALIDASRMPSLSQEEETHYKNDEQEEEIISSEAWRKLRNYHRTADSFCRQNIATTQRHSRPSYVAVLDNMFQLSNDDEDSNEEEGGRGGRSRIVEHHSADITTTTPVEANHKNMMRRKRMSQEDIEKLNRLKKAHIEKRNQVLNTMKKIVSAGESPQGVQSTEEESGSGTATEITTTGIPASQNDDEKDTTTTQKQRYETIIGTKLNSIHDREMKRLTEQLVQLQLQLKIINGCFSLSFGFLNGFLNRLSKRYATMMSGNTLVLAKSIIDDNYEDATFTICLIVAYMLGTSFFFIVKYDPNTQQRLQLHRIRRFIVKVMKLWRNGHTTNNDLKEEEKEEERQEEEELRGDKGTTTINVEDYQESKELDFDEEWVDVIFVCVVVFFMGILSDVMKLYGGCFQGDGEDNGDDSCDSTCDTYPGLYYLLPVAVITGVVAGGYLTEHKFGTTVNMITGHLGKVPQNLIKIILLLLQPPPSSSDDGNGNDDDNDQTTQNKKREEEEEEERKQQKEKHRKEKKKAMDTLLLSLFIIICFFVGALVGFKIPATTTCKSFHQYYAIATSWSVILVIMILCIHTTCEIKMKQTEQDIMYEKEEIKQMLAELAKET